MIVKLAKPKKRWRSAKKMGNELPEKITRIDIFRIERGKRKLCNCPNPHYEIDCYIGDSRGIYSFRINPSTVGQYTGLTDKNGEKIFEGDIVDFNIRGDDESYGVVKYSVEETEFYLAYDNLTLGLGRNNYSWELEVIGNIHDNPELLEAKE